MVSQKVKTRIQAGVGMILTIPIIIVFGIAAFGHAVNKVKPPTITKNLECYATDGNYTTENSTYASYGLVDLVLTARNTAISKFDAPNLCPIPSDQLCKMLVPVKIPDDFVNVSE